MKAQDRIENQQLDDRTIYLWGMVNDKSARHVVDRLMYLDFETTRLPGARVIPKLQGR